MKFIIKHIASNMNNIFVSLFFLVQYSIPIAKINAINDTYIIFFSPLFYTKVKHDSYFSLCICFFIAPTRSLNNSTTSGS